MQTLEQKMQGEILKLTILTMRFDGMRKQYDSAVLSDDNVAADIFRTQLHEVLDMMLDCSSISMSITRQLIKPKDGGQSS